MAYFPMVPKGGAGGFSELLIDYDPSEMTGITITLSHAASAEGHTPESYTVTLDNTGEVEVDVKNLGLWVVTWTHEGQSHREEYDVHYYGYHHIMLHESFTWRLWATAGGIPINQYNSLSQLLADEAAVRRLFIVHDAVDYMCENANSTQNQDLITIINNGLCAKWANLNDYALDNMEADAVLSDLMDDADLYGYGELIEDNGDYVPKGNVPVMTSNSAPYGSVIGDGIYSSTFEKFNAFNKNISSMWVSNNSDYSVAYIGYVFTNPVKIKKVVYTRDVLAGYAGTCTAKLQATNDGTNWIDITEEFTFDQLSSNYEEIEWTPTKNAEAYYLGARLKFLTHIPVVGLNKCNPRCVELQFYGRELKVSVPTMTSNTAPYGEASASHASNSYPAWQVFDGNDSTAWSLGVTTNCWVGYESVKPMRAEFVKIKVYKGGSGNSELKNFKIQGSNDGTNWDDLYTGLVPVGGTDLAFTLDNPTNYKYHRLYAIDTYHTSVGILTLQFYGKDYSEKEFANDGSKWLYDHGVELETFEEYKGDSSCVARKDSDELYCETKATSAEVSWNASNDMSGYSKLFGKVGQHLVAGNDNIYIGIRQSPSSTLLAYTAFNAGSDRILALDISSFSGTHYAQVSASYINKIMSCQELWLE